MKQRRIIMVCLRCEKDKKIAAKGLCAACYSWTKYRNNSERINVVNVGKTCSVSGCAKSSFAKGFCSTHYHSHAQHPCKFIWRILRSRYGAEQLPASWERFDGFLADVGERPTPSHRLRRFDSTKPYSKENVSWVAPMEKKNGPSALERSAYNRSWIIKRHFKMSEKEHAKIVADQNGVCAICQQPELHVIKRTGKLKELSLDHCHTTGQARGLLCAKCNIGIGALRDDPVLLLRAIEYLKKHAS